MKNRGRTELITRILQAANTGNSMSKIMYAVSLSSGPLHTYLDFLQERRLLSYDSDSRRYHLTDKGIKFLEISDTIGGMLFVDRNSHALIPALDSAGLAGQRR